MPQHRTAAEQVFRHTKACQVRELVGDNLCVEGTGCRGQRNGRNAVHLLGTLQLGAGSMLVRLEGETQPLDHFCFGYGLIDVAKELASLVLWIRDRRKG